MKRPLIVIVALLFAVGMGYVTWQSMENRSVAEIPVIDYSDMDKPAVDKIRRMLSGVETNPTSDEAWGNLAISLQLHGAFDTAQKCFAEAGRLNSDNFRWPYLAALGMVNEGFPGASALLEKAREQKPDYVPLLVHLGESYLAEDKPAMAREPFEAALKLQPSSTRADFGLAKVDRAEKKYDKVITRLQRLIAQKSESYEILQMYVDVLNTVGEKEKLLEVESLYQTILAQKSGAVELTDPERNKYEAEGVSKYWRYKNGLRHMEYGRYTEAITEFKAGLEVKEDAELLHKLAICYLTIGEKEEALKNVQRAAFVMPERSRYVSDYGSLLAETDPVAGEEFMKQALSQESSDKFVVLNYLNFLKRENRWGDVIRLLRDSYEDNKDVPFFRSNFAWYASVAPDGKVRAPKEALGVVNYILRKESALRTDVYDVFAAVYAANGNFERATHYSALSIAAAKARRDLALMENLEHRHALYKSGKPFVLPRQGRKAIL